VRALALTSIEEVFHEVEAGDADFGVVPIENSSEGTVNNTLDMFLTSPLRICGEIELRIHHNLMGSMTSLSDVVRVCAHPQALAQCRGWLQENMPASSGCRSAATPRAPAVRATKTGTARSPRPPRPRSTVSTC
jgi:chorismate mutase/prephenate dehydratase